MSVLSAPPAHTDAGSGGYAPAAPRKAPVKPAKPGKKPPAGTPPTTDPFGDLVSTATQQAKSQIDAEIAAITGQQASELASARENARQMSLASLAGANLIHGYGTPVADAYGSAAKALAALAQGYTGTLRTDAAGDAAAVQHDLDVGNRPMGAGAVGSNPGQQAVDRGDSLANFVYGTGGAQPATALGAAGAAAAAREAAVPETIIGHGQELGLGSLGAAQQAIAKLAPLIAQTKAKLPGLQASILSNLATTESKLAKSNTPRIIGSAGSGYYAIDPTTGKMTQILAPTASAASHVRTFSSGGDEYAIDPTTGKVSRIVDNPAKAPSGSLKAVKTKDGTALVDPHTGKIVEVLPAAAAAKKGALTLTSARTWVGTLGKTVTLKSASGKTAVNPDGTPATKTTHKLRYMQAYSFLRRNGIADTDARTLLATSYQRGQDGRSWLTNDEQAALAHVQKGVTQPGYIGTTVNHQRVKGLTKIRTVRNGDQVLGYLTPDQYQVLNSAGIAPVVHPGAPGGGYWIQPDA